LFGPSTIFVNYIFTDLEGFLGDLGTRFAIVFITDDIFDSEIRLELGLVYSQISLVVLVRTLDQQTIKELLIGNGLILFDLHSQFI